jgi:hypothetical protein
LREDQFLASAILRAFEDDTLLLRVAAGLRPTDLGRELGVTRVRAGIRIRRARERQELRRQMGIYRES